MSMAELSEDLVLEIVKRLPLKYAVQCSVLNKNILRSISHHPNFLPYYSTIFRSSSRNPKIFTKIGEEIRSVSNDIHPLRRSETLDMIVSIKAACNGLLFLRLNKSNPLHFVFNPTTAAIMAIPHKFIFTTIPTIATPTGIRLPYSADDFCLAVPDGSYSFKLVAVDALCRLEFRVFDPFTRVRFRVNFEHEGRFKLMMGAVYTQGSVYWLGDGGRITVALDVEKKEVRLIDGPVEKGKRNKWFGFADGAVHFVYMSASQIVICRLDHVSAEWRVKHTISNPRDNNHRDAPLLYDGRVLFVLRKNGEGKNGEGGDIYRYDLARDWWDEIESVDCKQKFFSYNSSFVKVSDTYLNEKNTDLWKDEDIRNALLGLQKLLRPAEGDRNEAQDKGKAIPKRITRCSIFGVKRRKIDRSVLM